MRSYDINVFQEIYSVILRIYKWGYLGGAYKGSPKKVLVAWLRGGALGAATNEKLRSKGK